MQKSGSKSQSKSPILGMKKVFNANYAKNMAKGYDLKVTLKKKVPKVGGMWVAGNWVKGSKKSYTVWVPNGARKGKKLTIRISTALGKGYGNGPEVKKVIKVK